MNIPKLVSAAALLVLHLTAPAQTISEETPPFSCGNRLVSGITCSGRYCDNIQVHCGGLPREVYDVRWSKFVSEEGDPVARCNVPNPMERGDLPAGEPAFITGFSCNGRYCDNVALECVALKNEIPRSFGGSACQWTDWVSEETPFRGFALNWGAISMQCRGNYCDDKRFLICPIAPR